MARRAHGVGIGVALSHVEPLIGPHCERLLAVARAADAAGVAQLALSEHVTLTRVITGHPGPGPGVFPFPGSEQYPEPLVTLAAMGAVTSRVRLSTNILIGTLRPAVLLAKMAATLDCLCGGRLELGVGTGWHREEFEALNVPMTNLPGRLDDTLRACRALWRERPASFSSETVSFTDMYCCPAPVQAEIPLWIGGAATKGMARRVAELGHGWSPMGGSDPAEVRAGLALIEQACQRIDRDPAGIGVRVSLFPPSDAGPSERIASMLAPLTELVEAGVTLVQVPLPQLVDLVEDTHEVLAAVVAAAGELVGATTV